MRCLLTTALSGSKLCRMRPAILTILLLACGLAFGQQFQDVSAKGSPASLGVKHDSEDMGRPYEVVRNHSSKAILAMVAIVRATDDQGGVIPCTSSMDYAFKTDALTPQEERFACLMGSPDEGKVTSAVGAVLFVQFDDGTTWGDPTAGKELLAARPQKLAFLKNLVETYYESGEDAFTTLLNEPKPMSPEHMVAACLKGDAKYEKIATIDLAKKRLAAAQGWRAVGIF
jgi:hypothetical protein